MKSAAPIVVATVVSLTIIAVGGFWLGAFCWFGGYVHVQQVFGWSAVTIGVAVAAFHWRAFPRRWPLHAGFFIGSQLLFVGAVAAGQVFYVGPGSPSEAAYLFAIAMRGGL